MISNHIVTNLVKFMLSEATSQCTVCGKGFPYRKSKQFCSNACKQQAYLANKEGISLPPVKKIETSAYDFSLSEYTAYLKEADNGMNLLSYCFLRRNLKGSPDLMQVKTYFDGFFHGNYTWWDYFESVKETRAYVNFTEDFLSNKFSVGV